MAPKALIVDDDPIVRDLAEDILGEAGFETVVVTRGDEAIDAVRVHRPDLVVLDVMLPGIDGLTVCKTIKSDPRTQGIKVAVVTGRGFPGEKERALRCGADLYLTKPFEAAVFLEKISGLLK